MASAAADSHHDDGHHDEVHHYDYVKIWGVLLALMFLSLAGSETGILYVTLFSAFGIAFIKAWIVIRYFMHVDIHKPFVHYFMATSIVFMVLFFAGTAPDVMRHEGQRWENVAAKTEIERALAEQAAGGSGHHGEASHDGQDGHEAPKGDAHGAGGDHH